MIRSQLPPLGALLAFEAAAQSGSFTRAADRLFVTPAAISQKIRLLEQQLDIVLFERSKKGVKLTRAGQSYLVFIHEALDKIRLGQQQLEMFRNLNVLTITALPSVALKWLMPRVLKWMDLNPGIEIRVEASHARVDFNRSASDICISFGEQDYTGPNYAGLHKELLSVDSVSMFASPELLKSLNGSDDLQSIVQLPMIHVDWGDDNPSLPDWEDWLQAAGLNMAVPKAGAHFNLSSMAIDAAVQGKGLLLGQNMLIADEIASGQLIKPLALNLPLRQAYYLVYPNRTLDNLHASTFIEWLKQS